MQTQTEMILNHLKAGGEITSLDALNHFGCMRLASRISEIKKDNPRLDIRDEFVHRVNHEGLTKQFKKYWIHKEKLAPDMFFSADVQKQHELDKDE